MGTPKYVVVALSVIVAVAVCGCALMPVQVSPEEAIGNSLAVMKDGFETEDPDKVLTAYSEDYEGAYGEGKEEAGETLHSLNDQGYWDGMTVNVEDAEITVDGDTATVAPVDFSGVARHQQRTVLAP